MYDLDNDNSECFNLLDPKNIDNVNNVLKKQLNDTLNASLVDKNCFMMKTIIAENTILSLANLIYILGGFIENNVSQMTCNMLGTLCGKNMLDTQISEKKREELQLNLNLHINKINFADFINPYNLYDTNNDIYYVGECNYINFVKSFNYFSGMVMSKGMPNFTNDKYTIKSNNILPHLIVFKKLT